MNDKEVRLLILIQVERSDGDKSDIRESGSIRTRSANRAYRENYDSIFPPKEDMSDRLN